MRNKEQTFDEVNEFDSLSPYERYHVEKYGTLPPPTYLPFESYEHSEYPSLREQAEIFEQLNPEQ